MVVAFLWLTRTFSLSFNEEEEPEEEKTVVLFIGFEFKKILDCFR